MKLVRAVIPMCPECGAEMAKAGTMPFYECLGRRGCKAVHEHSVHWGCDRKHIPDVAGVVVKMRSLVDMMEKEGDGPTVHSYELHKLTDELEGKL